MRMTVCRFVVNGSTSPWSAGDSPSFDSVHSVRSVVTRLSLNREEAREGHPSEVSANRSVVSGATGWEIRPSLLFSDAVEGFRISHVKPVEFVGRSGVESCIQRGDPTRIVGGLG